MTPKQQIKERENTLLEMTGACCAQHLNDDYFQLCEKLIKKMGRKHEVPFKRGKLEIWAAAVVYAIGSINFLFDKATEPYMNSTQISEYFGAKPTTVSQKAGKIRDMFNMGYFDNDFSTQRMAEENPFNNFVTVDGIITPLDYLPEDFQQQVKDARATGGDIEFFTKKS
ncbi:MAG TPA: DUF6398 domain-containing protein [Flavobacteriaceae bacterium]|nr:DUF6398 domain-containing protein [Flavobacteriaceae bacterium]